MRIISNCVGCAHCEVFCPTGAIKVFGKANIVGDCKECGVCLKFCPQKAIEPNEEM
ncbi:MAG: 4Fe-4S binding protein [Halobacteriota archaeon]